MEMIGLVGEEGIDKYRGKSMNQADRQPFNHGLYY